MRAALLVVGALLSVGVVGIAAGEALGLCAPTKLPAPQAELDAVHDYDPSLEVLAPPSLDLLSAQDSHACVGEIRPGAQQSNGCTVSWIFEDQAGALYQTTAGHCTSSVGQAIGVTGVGTIGTVVFRVNGGVGNDIALIRIDPALYDLVNPTLCHWGGPQGVATPEDTTTDALVVNGMLHYGWGVAFRNDPVDRARAGYVYGPDRSMEGSGWFADGSIRMRGFTDGGDSGSPMMLANGLAVAVHTHRLHAADPSQPLGAYFGTKAATRLDLMLPRMEAATGLDLEIVKGEPVDLTLPIV